MTPSPAPTSGVPSEVQRGLRTLVAAVVGFGVAELVRVGIHVPASDVAIVIPILTAAAATGYNALALYLEKRFSWAKVLMLGIGVPK